MFKLLKQLPPLLSSKEKVRFYLIFPFLLLLMVLETLGLGMIIPIVKVVNMIWGYDYEDIICNCLCNCVRHSPKFYRLFLEIP